MQKLAAARKPRVDEILKTTPTTKGDLTLQRGYSPVLADDRDFSRAVIVPWVRKIASGGYVARDYPAQSLVP